MFLTKYYQVQIRVPPALKRDEKSSEVLRWALRAHTSVLLGCCGFFVCNLMTSVENLTNEFLMLDIRERASSREGRVELP